MTSTFVSPSQEIKVKPLNFLVATFILFWLIWIPLDFSHLGIGGFYIPEGASSLLGLLGVLMPAAVAIVLSDHAGGHEALGVLLKRLGIVLHWRPRLQPCLVIIHRLMDLSFAAMLLGEAY